MSSIDTLLSYNELTSWEYHVEEFNKLQSQYDLWMPSSYIWYKMVPAVLLTAVICSIVFWLVSPAVVDTLLRPDDTDDYNDDDKKSYISSSSSSSSSSKFTKKRTKMRYQFTNLCFNVAVGLLGVYYQYWIIPTLPSYSTEIPTIQKIPNNPELYLMSAMQLGYQLWALPMGLIVVKEPTEMILHHCAVVLSSTMSGFVTLGFRYFSPYFYGLMELSSIPLAVMNTFKDNPQWMHKYQFTYLVTRGAFSFGFLYFRIYLWFFIGPRFLLHNFFTFYTTEWRIEKLFLGAQWILAMFLGILQFYWAYLVTKGIVSFFVRFFASLLVPSSRKSKDKTKQS